MALLIDNRQKFHKLDLRYLRPLMLKILKELDCKDREVSLSLVDNQEIQIINRDYLRRDKPTNVISFGMQEGEWQNIQPDVLGDIVISVETAYRDALRNDIDVTDEILFFIHSWCASFARL